MSQCEGFRSACEIEPKLVSEILIDNCCTTDATLSLILKGLLNQTKVRILTLRRTQIGSDSVSQLKLLLNLRAPRGLEDLRIEDCQIEHATLTRFLSLLKEETQLSALTLVG